MHVCGWPAARLTFVLKQKLTKIPFAHPGYSLKMFTKHFLNARHQIKSPEKALKNLSVYAWISPFDLVFVDSYLLFKLY